MNTVPSAEGPTYSFGPPGKATTSNCPALAATDVVPVAVALAAETTVAPAASALLTTALADATSIVEVDTAVVAPEASVLPEEEEPEAEPEEERTRELIVWGVVSRNAMVGPATS